MRTLRVAVATLSTLSCLLTMACGNAPPAPLVVATAPAASAAAPTTPEPPDDPMPRLHTGTLKHEEVSRDPNLKLVGRFVGDGYEILQAAVGDDFAGARVAVDVDAGDGSAHGSIAAFSTRQSSAWRGPNVPAGVWIRRPVADARSPVKGSLFTDSYRTTPGKRADFRVTDVATMRSDPAVRVRWLNALAHHVDTFGVSAWTSFATTRLRAIDDQLAAKQKPLTTAKAKDGGARRARIAPARPPAHDDLARLMETTTGSTAVQEALQENRALFTSLAKEPSVVPVESLALPEVGHHPWDRMMKALAAPPPEPLAAYTPAEFYYARAVDLPSLFRLLDQVDAWGTPAVQALDGAAEDRDLANRYETQLALRRGPLTRALGPSVIGEVAVIGSDPYLKDGSDVTVMLRVKSRALLDVALAAALADLENAHGPLTRESRVYAGVTVNLARSADGAVAQQRASVADIELVSNSPAAMNVVLDTVQGHHPRLADELDFRFMLARDSGVRNDVLAYLGDRFVSTVVGPKQKILEARREMARGELETPGFAALLYGVMNGRSPTTVDEILRAGLLAKEELRHTNAAPITWQPGTAARSSWGSASAMTPLIDLPALTRVTLSEQASYERFSRSYQREWSAYIDPVALRLVFDGQTVKASLRELPLIDETDYRKLSDFVGAAHFATGAIENGGRIVLGIGADSKMRHDLTYALKGLSSHALSLDFLGDWAAIGAVDRSVLARAALSFDDDAPQMPDSNGRRRGDFSIVPSLPLYAEIAVKSTAGAALALAAARVMANETIPDMFEWGEAGRYRGVTMVRVAIKKDLARGLLADGPDLNVYYAVTSGALVFALQQWVLERRIDEQLDGTGPQAKPATDPNETQLAFEMASEPGRALSSLIGWGLEGKLRAHAGASRGEADLLFQGAPERAADPEALRSLAIAYFGAAPVTPDGAAYVLAREGPRDPVSGTDFEPTWQDLPIAGSPVAKLLATLTRVRTEVSFDDEGKDDKGESMRSLSARATFVLR